MGPDCGTALIAGVPLAFANAVPRGDIGIVAASGTGLQEVSCLLARLGAGVSHGIGVGGRDLDERVGALGTLAAIDALERDAATEVVVLLSKPPAPRVAEAVLERLARSPKRSVVCFLGLDKPGLARTLHEAAEMATGKKIEGAGSETRRVRGRVERRCIAEVRFAARRKRSSVAAASRGIASSTSAMTGSRAAGPIP